jgi:hypothetical protein
VIGRGKTFDGSVELVAYGWLAPKDTVGPSSRRQFCVWVEYPPAEIAPGTCGGPLDPAYQGALTIDDRIQAFGPPSKRHTEIGGRLSPDVASVRVTYRHPGSAKQIRIAAVYFDAKIRGLVPFRGIRAEAFDASGQVIGSVGMG